MRAWLVGLIALISACAAGGEQDMLASAPSPFPVARGQAPPPPARAVAGQTAPPEGRASGGIDFGRWRQADPAVYQPAFQSQIVQRMAGKDDAAMRADLEANGFACAEGGAHLQCRIEIMERQCAFDWYVVREAARADPVAGFDIMCLGAN